MKREEEIELAWRKKAVQSNHKYDEKSFKEAVEWADKHPKRYNQDELCDIQLEMMRQRDKRLINKACEWLSKTLFIHTEEIEDKFWNETKTFDYVASDFNSVSSFIENFRKAMEE